tara:strand:+ start:204 stop:839 length:636 start_codon:yes stop_codon:yes gene_type:complete
MARTATFQSLENRFKMAAGLATLTQVDEFFFKEALNSRAQTAWHRCKWPDLLKLVEKTVAATTNPTADKAVQIDNDLNIMEIHQVFTKNPYTDRTAILLDFKLLDGYLILPANSSVTSVFIVGTAVRPTYGKDAGEESNVPEFLANYLTAGSLSDFLRGDGQTEAAFQEENRAEEYLTLEIDRAERLQSQNKITFNTYPSYSFGVSVLTTT